jgi:hypothetical protein
MPYCQSLVLMDRKLGKPYCRSLILDGQEACLYSYKHYAVYVCVPSFKSFV